MLKLQPLPETMSNKFEVLDAQIISFQKKIYQKNRNNPQENEKKRIKLLLLS